MSRCPVVAAPFQETQGRDARASVGGILLPVSRGCTRLPVEGSFTLGSFIGGTHGWAQRNLSPLRLPADTVAVSTTHNASLPPHIKDFLTPF